MARGPARARPDRHPRRRDRRDLFGLSGRGGGDGLDLPGAERGFLEARLADRDHPTQVGRALDQLGVEHIAAYSPQARGRSERAFGTLQDRLVKELRLAGITTVEAANVFIRDVYAPAYDARFAVEAAGEGSAFTPIPGVDLDEILCVQEERRVGNDNCVSYRTLKLQIPETPMRPPFVKARVKVHLYPDGSHAVFHGPRCIGRYDEKGQPKLILRAA